VLIIRRSKLYYTASGIVTLCRWPSGAQVERGLVARLHGFPVSSKIYEMVAKFQWRTQEFCSGGGGGSTNSVEDRQNRDLGAVAP